METLPNKWKLSFIRGAIALFLLGVVTMVETVIFSRTGTLSSMIIFLVVLSIFILTSLYAFVKVDKVRTLLGKGSAPKSE